MPWISLSPHSCPAGSTTSGNDGALTFAAQAAFQFLGVYLSTMPLNASYDAISTLHLSCSRLFWSTHESAKRCISFQVLAWKFAPRHLHNLIIVPNPNIVVVQLVLLLLRELCQWFACDANWFRWRLKSLVAAKQRLPPTLRFLFRPPSEPAEAGASGITVCEPPQPSS